MIREQRLILVFKRIHETVIIILKYINIVHIFSIFVGNNLWIKLTNKKFI
jgi:hypothetical protein